jgi:hypothetical protein
VAKEAIVVFDRLTKALLALIGVALSANALALWIGPRAATADVPNILRARQFLLVDEKGNELGSLGLSLLAGATELRLRAPGEDKDGVLVSALRGGRSLLSLGGEKGRVSLGTTFMVKDPANLNVSATAPHVSLFDTEGHVRAVLGAQGISPASPLLLLDMNGKVVWKAP